MDASHPSPHSPTQRRRYAYITLITRASYLAGVVILAHTLRQHGSRHPLIVLYTPCSLAAHAVRALELEAAAHAGLLELRTCAPLRPPGDAQVSLIAERFADTWTKLRVFEAVARDDDRFDAVCYLDADVAVFGRADAVFAAAEENLPREWLGASHACVCNRDADPWAPADWRPENCAHTRTAAAMRGAEGQGEGEAPPTQPPTGAEAGPATHRLLNGGMFVFRPSRPLWDDMLAFFRRTPLLPTFQFPDQDFLAHYFGGRWRALGWRFNALKTMRYWHADLWRDDRDVVCLHYIVDKPWTRRIGADGVAGYRGRDGATHRWWWDAYDAWEEARLAEGNDLVVSLVRRGVAPPLKGAEGWTDGGIDDGLAAIGGAVQAFANNRVPAENELPRKTEIAA
ncbi:nucleotide-diphospho-sugar transferase [Xylariomycetidae sp. FL0641]|nr:nucleotide-diphospho-sugar transferase [Xylariomycetidae sp. FL0641]